jgi:hypothetical protein
MDDHPHVAMTGGKSLIRPNVKVYKGVNHKISPPE